MNYKNGKTTRFIGNVLFILYTAFIVYFLIFSEWYGRTGEMNNYHYNLELFREIKRFWEYRHQVGIVSMIMNLFGNILIFMPFGFFLPMASRFRSIFATTFGSFILSLAVEMFQFITKVGCFDVDDLLLNTVGGIIGHIIFIICAAKGRKNGQNKKKRKKYRRS